MGWCKTYPSPNLSLRTRNGCHWKPFIWYMIRGVWPGLIGFEKPRLARPVAGVQWYEKPRGVAMSFDSKSYILSL